MRSRSTLFLPSCFFLLCQITHCSAINIRESISIGSIQQWIQINSEKNQAPILLFLHGGPGNSAMSYAHKFTSELQKHFIVVLWDQRETGKTLQLNSSPSLSLARMEADVHEMIEYLCARFSQPKIYLMGHSWGGFLALRMAALYPNQLEACFAISPMIAQLQSERLSLVWLMEMAKKANNQQAIAQLSKVTVPFQNAEQIYFHRHWLAHFSGNKPVPKSFVERWAAKWLGVFNEASAIDFKIASPNLNCPVYFFIGEKDYQTHFSLAEEYYNLLQAKKKELFWFNNSGHNLNLTEPKKIQEIIISLTHN
jgi:pimeloyl-ACP methyl ester carboxylesterase